MSGVEAAGLILGAIPLIISALEHYRESAEVLEGWWKIKSEYRKCKNNLNYHRVAFEENLEELLLPLIADEDKLKRLIDNPGGLEWKDVALELALKERMPKTYAAYLDTISMMLEIVEGLNYALGTNKTHFQNRVTDPQQVSPNGSSVDDLISHVTLRSMANIEYQAQRIKLAFNKRTRQELFEEFGTYNARLQDILGSSDRLAGLRRARVTAKSAAISSGLWKLWSHANNVFECLTDAWSCKCQSLHHANLLLQHRGSSAVSFRVVFWFKPLLEDQLPWTWQDTCIKLLESDSVTSIELQVPAMATTNVPIIPKTQNSPQINVHVKEKSSRWSFINKIKHKSGELHVTHGVPSPALPAVAPIPRAPINGTSTKPKVSFVEPSSPKKVESHSNPKITNLCGAITACSKGTDLPEYGCLNGATHQYLMQPLCTADNKPQKFVTLETLLSKNRPIDLSRSQRYQIALILASSHLQLHPTPWLKSKWSKSDIFFLYDDEDSICIEQPYISRSLCKNLQAKRNGISVVNSHTFQDSVRNLGIMLLELCFGIAIEEYKGRLKFSGSMDEQMLQVINHAAADKWSREVVGETGQQYFDAVTLCLHNVPDGDSIEGKEDKWREDMYVKVVEPLKHCHGQLVSV